MLSSTPEHRGQEGDHFQGSSSDPHTNTVAQVMYPSPRIQTFTHENKHEKGLYLVENIKHYHVKVNLCKIFR